MILILDHLICFAVCFVALRFHVFFCSLTLWPGFSFIVKCQNAFGVMYQFSRDIIALLRNASAFFEG